MARKDYAMTEATYASFVREGRGAGEGPDYRPWLRVDDVPSRGRSRRTFCTLTGRAHDFLSDGEFLAFHRLWWDEAVVDIREQYPLPRAHTLAVAGRLRVRHPADGRTGMPIVQTTDMLVTRSVGGRPSLRATAVKAASDLSDRTLAKLDIERAFWTERGVEWDIVLDRDVKTTTVRNIAWARGALLPGLGDPRAAGEALLGALGRFGSGPASLACQEFDRGHGLAEGRGLSLLRLLIGMRIVETDMGHRHIVERPASAFAWRAGAAAVPRFVSRGGAR